MVVHQHQLRERWLHAIRMVRTLMAGVPDQVMLKGHHHNHRMAGLQGIALVQEPVDSFYRTCHASFQRQA